MTLRALPPVLALACAFLCGAHPAEAHALPVAADPAPSVTEARPPQDVRLTFSEGVNGALSTASVWNAAGRRVDSGADGRGGTEITVRLPPRLRSGTYLVAWRAISAEDGHATVGTYTFNVVRAGPRPPVPAAALGGTGWPVSLIAVAARWLQLTGTVFWLGAIVCIAFVLKVPERADGASAEPAWRGAARAERLGTLALGVLVPAAVAGLACQAYIDIPDLSRDLTRPVLEGLLLHTPYGDLWLLSQALVMVALLLRWTARVALRREVRQHPWGHAAVRDYTLALAVGYALILATSSHAATVHLGGEGVLSAPVLIDWLHVLASGAWVGGIVVIAAAILPVGEASGGDGDVLDLLDRFSPLAYGSVAVLGLTGIFNADVHVPSLGAMLGSAYGAALLIKLALMASMMSLSAVTVLSVRPRLRRRREDPRTLRKARRTLIFLVRVSAALGTGVLLATAVMNTFPISPSSLS